MSNFLLALQFLTIIPMRIKNVSERKLAGSLVYFPLAGLLIGLFLAGLSILLAALYIPEFAAAAIITVALCVITGGMHLDGLSDTFDALASGKPREKCLEIMRDSHSGAMGVISIVCALLLKTAFIFSLRTHGYLPALILMCVLSRWSLVSAMFFFPYARSEGKAKIYMHNINGKIFLTAALVTLFIVIFIWKLNGLFLFVLASAIAWIISKFITRKLGGITGDTLGAQCELIELVVLFYFLL